MRYKIVAPAIVTLAIVTLTAIATVTLLRAQAPQKDRLQFVVILNRHGVRTPLATPEQLAEYAPAPWPLFSAPTAFLTPRGARLIRLMGAYEREYLIQTGLLSPTGCQDAGKFYFHSDVNSRDVDSAWDFARSLLPGCDTTIHVVPEGSSDPIFRPDEAHIGPYDPELAREAFLSAAGIPNDWREELDAVNHVLLGAASQNTALRNHIAAPKKPLMQLPLESASGTPSTIFSPMLAGAFSVADALLAEYLDGVSGKDLGWGRIDGATLHQLRVFQDRYLRAATNPYNAKAISSNLLSHILRSLEQADGNTPVAGSLGKPGDRALALFGHDSDLMRVSNLLGISWEVEKGLPRDVPPDCALVFELWRNAAGQSSVKVYFQTQTFAQLMSEQVLTLRSPPARVELTVPQCDPCDVKAFGATVSSVIDPAFIAR